MNSEGYLVTKDGDYILGEGGRIQLPTDLNELSVDSQGNIFADGQYVDTFALVDFEDYNYLEEYGENPVSYTHLDVYKRQELNRFSSRFLRH